MEQMRYLIEAVRRIRPAPLASSLCRWLGLNRRRVFECPHGTFYVNPVSNFGYQVLYSEYEPGMRRLLTEMLTSGSIFIDCGANEGYFSVIAARLVGVQGRVFAIEPQSRLQCIIHENLRLNSLSNAHVTHGALCDHAQDLALSLASDMNTGSSSLFRGTKYRQPVETVKGLTLAQFLDCHGLDSCDLMKMDVEGAEYDILSASRTVLQSGKVRGIILEYHPDILARNGHSQAEIHCLLLDCGYQHKTEYGHEVYRHAAFLRSALSGS